jgi:hypothetical protein
MGQYQQWLHYQEVDRRFRATLEALETELVRLESQLDTVFLDQLVQQANPLAANSIISALLARQSTGTNGHIPSNNESSSFSQTFEQESVASLDTPSPEAHLHGGALPDFAPQQVEQSEHYFEFPSFPPASHPEIELLPEDLFAFMDENALTDPQVELPWWLRKITIASSDAESGRPIDQESMRTNRLVQRWIERWGRQTWTVFTPEGESEDTPDAP